MNWSVIPEIFFDIIGRIVPGILLILAAVAVFLGPRQAVTELWTTSGAINVTLLLLLAVLAYFIAIVTKELFEWTYVRVKVGRDRKTPAEETNVAPVMLSFYEARSEMPAEGYRLLKIQAEKNFCEVMVVGLAILLPVNLWLSFPQSGPYLYDRHLLTAALLLGLLACWSWRKTLEWVYQECLRELDSIVRRKSRETPADPHHPAPEWRDTST